ncbi:hypothetical protein [Burkholderia sp. Bp9143]|nr:hypothetical protein [Burkholderia sp. Bp9143]
MWLVIRLGVESFFIFYGYWGIYFSSDLAGHDGGPVGRMPA